MDRCLFIFSLGADKVSKGIKIQVCDGCQRRQSGRRCAKDGGAVINNGDRWFGVMDFREVEERGGRKIEKEGR